MKYVCVRQRGTTDCGAACLATVCKHYGKSLSVEKIRQLTSTGDMGCRLYDLLNSAKKLGFEAKAMKIEYKEKLSSNISLPIIVQLTTQYTLSHYVVIFKITEKELIVSDPAKGVYMLKKEEFFEAWSGSALFLMPSDNFKTKRFQSVWIQLWKYLEPSYEKIFFLVVLTLVITIFNSLIAFYIRYLLDNLKFGIKQKSLIFALFLLFSIQFISAFIRLFRRKKLNDLGAHIYHKLIFCIYSRILKFPMKYFNTHSTGEIIARFQDAFTIQQILNVALLEIAMDIITMTAGSFFLLYLNPVLFLICVVFAFIIGTISLKAKEKIFCAQEKIILQNDKLVSALHETLEGIETIKAYAMENKKEKNFYDYFNSFITSVFHGETLSEKQNTYIKFISGICEILTLSIGVCFVQSDLLSVGSFISFYALFGIFIEPLIDFINRQPLLQHSKIAAERLLEMLDIPIETQESADNKEIIYNGNIEFCNISFGYREDKNIFEDFSLLIKKGSNTAIVGETGSGKTTLAKLLMRFYSLANGEIYINGDNIDDVPVNYFRSRIGYVSQEPFLFQLTIKENLFPYESEYDEDAMISICKEMQLHDKILSLPYGYDTILEKDGVFFSAGERQRLCIARALLKNPDILILDEVTSNLDFITEAAILDIINSSKYQNITKIMIAHRLNTICNCDDIIVLHNGRVFERGTHINLMSNKKMYYNMFYKGSV